MSVMFSQLKETPVVPTVRTQRHIRVGRTTVSYTHEVAAGTAPERRLFLFPGLLGCEVAYSASQHYLAQTVDAEVVTLTHDRSMLQAFHASHQRSRDGYAVLSDSDRVFGFKPKIILGHSMGGADTAHVIQHGIHKGKRLDVAAAGFESSVGLNGQIPNLGGSFGFLREEILSTRHIGDSQRKAMLATVGEYAKNPVLAMAEAVLAGTANIRGTVGEIERYGIPTVELFGSSDYLIRPPHDRPWAIIREGVGHLALCVEPEIAKMDAELLLQAADTQLLRRLA